MYALPNQKKEDWIESLEKIVKLEPSHISAYSLILEENTELFNMYEKHEFELLDEDTDIEMYEYTISYLKSNGYNQYEISNYAKKGFECKHNILYWKCENYVGLGVSASGFLNETRYNNLCELDEYEEIIHSGKKPIHNILYWKCENYVGLGVSASGFLNETRYNNLCELDEYEEIIHSGKKPIEWEEKLSIKDEIEESIFLGLRMNEGIKFKDFYEKYNFNFEEEYKNEIDKLKKMKLIETKDEGMKLTQKGREISNSVFVEFMK